MVIDDILHRGSVAERPSTAFLGRRSTAVAPTEACKFTLDETITKQTPEDKFYVAEAAIDSPPTHIVYNIHIQSFLCTPGAPRNEHPTTIVSCTSKENLSCSFTCI